MVIKMRKRCCSERTQTLMCIAVSAAVVATFLVLAVPYWLKGDFFGAVATGLIALFLLVGLFWFIKRERQRMKERLPKDDEMSRRVKEKAGYYAFLASIWTTLGLMWYAGTGVEEFGFPAILPRHVAALALAIVAVLWALFWAYFHHRGVE